VSICSSRGVAGGRNATTLAGTSCRVAGCGGRSGAGRYLRNRRRSPNSGARVPSPSHAHAAPCTRACGGFPLGLAGDGGAHLWVQAAHDEGAARLGASAAYVHCDPRGVLRAVQQQVDGGGVRKGVGAREHRQQLVRVQRRRAIPDDEGLFQLHRPLGIASHRRGGVCRAGRSAGASVSGDRRNDPAMPAIDHACSGWQGVQCVICTNGLVRQHHGRPIRPAGRAMHKQGREASPTAGGAAGRNGHDALQAQRSALPGRAWPQGLALARGVIAPHPRGRGRAGRTPAVATAVGMFTDPAAARRRATSLRDPRRPRAGDAGTESWRA
jgi:hypothetical protein